MAALAKTLLRTKRIPWTVGRWNVQSTAACSNAQKVNFEDHVSAFASKTNWEICRALTVLKFCSFQTFVENSEKWFEVSQRVPVVRQISQASVRVSFYSQFVGGREDEEIAAIAKRMSYAGVRPMLVGTMEEDVGQEKSLQEDLYDRNLDRVLGCADLVKKISTSTNPCVQLKMTSLFSPDVLERLSIIYKTCTSKMDLVERAADTMNRKVSLEIPGISAHDKNHLEKGIGRLKRIGQAVSSVGARLLVDAEFTQVNPALGLLCLAMQADLNLFKPIVWNTHQCYLREAQKNIEEEQSLAKELGVCSGYKLVRGAYIAVEKKRAIERGQDDPICSSYEDTNKNYDRCLEILVNQVKIDGDRCAFVAATHNEDSIRLLIRRMKEEGLEPNTESINFAQLFGMCDQLTFPLGSAGYNVYKSIPVGPLHEAIPYLARRATENQSVLAGARKEQEMLRAALKHRLKVL